MLGSDNVGPMPFPNSLKNGANLFIAGFAIPKATPAPKTALKFLSETYLTEKYQSKMLNVYGKMPTLKGAYDFAVSPGWAQMKQIAENSTAFPQYREFNIFADAAGDLLVQYLNDKISMDEALAKMKEQLDKIDKKIY